MTRDFDGLIIGGGPAGCSCALWLKMLGYRPCVIEKRARLGGLQNDSPFTNNWLVGMPGLTGQQFAEGIHNHVLAEEIHTELSADVIDVHRVARGFSATFVRDSGRHTVTGRVVVLASGVRAATGGLRAARDLLIGPGVRVAAHDFSGKAVAILGGGDNAFENYLFIESRKPRSLEIYARTLRARHVFLERVPVEHVHVGHYEVCDVSNTVNGKKYDAILAFYGWSAHLPFVERLELARTTGGFVVTDERCETSVPGVYAVGEVAQRMHPCCATSIADGVTAAKSIQEHMEVEAVPRFMRAARRAARLARDHFGPRDVAPTTASPDSSEGDPECSD